MWPRDTKGVEVMYTTALSHAHKGIHCLPPFFDLLTFPIGRKVLTILGHYTITRTKTVYWWHMITSRST